MEVTSFPVGHRIGKKTPPKGKRSIVVMIYVLQIFLTLTSNIDDRLDLAHQLLQPVSETASLSQSNVQWGIALPRESSPVSLSLLADPSRATGRRAVALVSCMSRDSKEVEIMAFRLQTVTNDSADSVVNYTNQKPFSVLSNCASRGTVTSGGRSASPIASIFLASASFRFDLHDARGRSKFNQRKLDFHLFF
jgi:hypothetical protein